jgi:cobyric acid synthase
VLTVFEQREKDFNKLADVVRNSMDIDKLYEIMNLEIPEKVAKGQGAG